MSPKIKFNSILPITYPIDDSSSTPSHDSNTMIKLVETHITSVVNSIYSMIKTWNRGTKVGIEPIPIPVEELTEVMVMKDDPIKTYEMV